MFSSIHDLFDEHFSFISYYISCWGFRSAVTSINFELILSLPWYPFQPFCSVKTCIFHSFKLTLQIWVSVNYLSLYSFPLYQSVFRSFNSEQQQQSSQLEKPTSSFLFCAACLPPGGDEGQWGSCWDSCRDSWVRSRSTLRSRTESRTFFSSDEKRPKTWRSTAAFSVGRPIPTRSLGITCRFTLTPFTVWFLKHTVYLWCFSLFNYLICTCTCPIILNNIVLHTSII